MPNEESFIAAYTQADRHRIAFASNGQVGSELRDDNRMFRTEIAKSLIQSPESANDDLIRDLYDAETAYSKASFGVHHQFVSCLASQLLERGGEINISHYYLACVFRGQDAYLSSQCVTLTKDARDRAIATIDTLIERSNGDVPPYYQRIRDNLARTP
ncbi:MAG: hypothetical protein WCI02_12580 [Planctomycetota bacterium]